MKLNYRIKGEGEPIVLLHGLFGSMDNLGMVARALEDEYRVISFDLRNHGRSPHSDAMSYPLMAEDVVAMMDELDIADAHFYGHSMGGKTSMQIALNYPDRVKSLIVGDIAPVAYGHHHNQILEGMREVEMQKPTSREAAQVILANYEDEPAILSFLLTNFRRNDAGDLAWRVGLDAIERDYEHIAKGNEGKAYDGQVLFIKGGASDYIQNDHREEILAFFPHAQVRIIEGAGHWFHAEKTEMTVRIVKRFLG